MEPDNPKVKISVVDENGAVRTPVFVHGVLEDYRAWDSQMDPFSKHFRAIAYSRRYNFPTRTG
jgi:hypothetical protein